MPSEISGRTTPMQSQFSTQGPQPLRPTSREQARDLTRVLSMTASTRWSDTILITSVTDITMIASTSARKSSSQQLRSANGLGSHLSRLPSSSWWVSCTPPLFSFLRSSQPQISHLSWLLQQITQTASSGFQSSTIWYTPVSSFSVVI